MLRFTEIFPKNVSAFVSGAEINFAYPKAGNFLNSGQEEYVKNEFKVSPLRVASIKQVHEDNIVIVDDKYLKDGKVPFADALITDLDNAVLTVRTADCLSIFLCDDKSRALGLIHAGWKSTAKKIAQKTVGKMKEHFKVDPGDLKAVFGPCIRSCCYEVSGELKEHFPREIILRDKKLFLDLALANRNQLVEAGLDIRKISDCRICTYCGDNCFSHRKDGEGAGRMLSLLVKNII
ncbi:MAG: peptidoglycan editing factor PgeF [Candidatus Omnitrophica bacterium]|nr:peptidoglycan editing factor PgeF [Candidatus Omnitrophota bacterium]